ncbi:hypothetical protein B0H14DRAFT_3571908 [Mycena olivaceomarginata]|nr:hypothetical protein B0H14DRAFT_3571908 [Mycena olivaceomarginata]
MPQVQVPHLHVPHQQAEVPDSESQAWWVDEEAALDDMDEETPTPVLHALEMSLPAPAPHAQVDDLEALDKDAGEGADAVVDSDVEAVSIRVPLDDLDDNIPPIPQAEVSKGDKETSDGDAEEGGDADADLDSDVIDDGDAEEGGEAAEVSSVEGVLVSVPLDNLDEETPTPITCGAETQTGMGDAEKGRGAVADSDSNLEGVRLRAPLDDIDNEYPPIPQAQVPQGDEEAASERDAEEEGVADADSASDVVEDRDTEKGGDPDADSRVEEVCVFTPLEDLDDTIPPILHPQPQVIEEAPDGHAVDGGDADTDTDSGAGDMRVSAPSEDFDEDIATPALHAQVPQVEHDEQWIVHTTDVPSPLMLPVGVTDTSSASNTLTTPPPVRVPATSDCQLDFPRSLFTTHTSLIASSSARAASTSLSSISPKATSLNPQQDTQTQPLALEPSPPHHPPPLLRTTGSFWDADHLVEMTASHGMSSNKQRVATQAHAYASLPPRSLPPVDAARLWYALDVLCTKARALGAGHRAQPPLSTTRLPSPISCLVSRLFVLRLHPKSPVPHMAGPRHGNDRIVWITSCAAR